jgi:ADP-ribose pyrophosphatase YjhB (NUDIX family)
MAGPDDLSGALGDVVGLADIARAIAQRGLTYATDPYDLERYETLAAASAAAYASLSGLPVEDVRGRFAREVGYPTAKVGADAAVFREGKLLLIRRADSGTWALPGGWIDPGESPERTAERELEQETGVSARAIEVIGVHTQQASADGKPHSSIHVTVHCDPDGPVDPQSTVEASEVAFRDPRSVESWHADHGAWALHAIRWLEARAS